MLSFDRGSAKYFVTVSALQVHDVSSQTPSRSTKQFQRKQTEIGVVYVKKLKSTANPAFFKIVRKITSPRSLVVTEIPIPRKRYQNIYNDMLDLKATDCFLIRSVFTGPL